MVSLGYRPSSRTARTTQRNSEEERKKEERGKKRGGGRRRRRKERGREGRGDEGGRRKCPSALPAGQSGGGFLQLRVVPLPRCARAPMNSIKSS